MNDDDGRYDGFRSRFRVDSRKFAQSFAGVAVRTGGVGGATAAAA